MSKAKTYLKYLPAEGEIQITDSACIYNGKVFPVLDIKAKAKRSIKIHNTGYKFDYIEESLCKKAVCYAVTTDAKIKEGDQMATHEGLEIAEYDGYSFDKDGEFCFKILAPISPHVTWEIKDGAEIEVKERWEYHDEIEDSEIGEGAFHNAGYPEVKYKFPYLIVKGPCGHYH